MELLNILHDDTSSSSSSSSSESSSSDEEFFFHYFMAESLEEEEIEDFAEDVVPKMSESEFKSHYKMLPSTYKFILDQIELGNTSGVGRNTISPEKQLQIFLWILVTTDSFRLISTKFRAPKSTIWCVFSKGVAAISALCSRFVQMPPKEQMSHVSQEFYDMGSFPGCVGCIDVCHIPIKPPKIDPELFINRMGFHSILLQVVVDHRYMFTDVYAGEVGCVHNSNVFRRSAIGKSLDVKPYHILGNDTFPLSEQLVTPFRDDGNLSPHEKRFNEALYSTLVTTERTFQLLKGRFKRLQFLEMSRTDLVPSVVVTCCVLHNICLMLGDEWIPTEEQMIILGTDTGQDSDSDIENEYTIPQDHTVEGVAKRLQLVNDF